MPKFDSNTALGEIWQEAARRLGQVDALDFAREIVESLECPGCGVRREIFQPAENIQEGQLHCPKCGKEATAIFLHSVAAESDCLGRSAREIGLPAWDVIWARRGSRSIGFELSGDNPLQKSSSNGI